ncbi:MAG: hypothetical protein ACK2U9_17660, partial [Anaerolineae bacterium]
GGTAVLDELAVTIDGAETEETGDPAQDTRLGLIVADGAAADLRGSTLDADALALEGGTLTVEQSVLTGGGIWGESDSRLVAHDNILGDHVIVANNSQLAGHVQLGEYAIVGGVSAVHQFVRIGAHAFIGGGSVVVMDVPPFCKATGNRARLHGTNTVGLRRRGFSPADLKAVRRAYRLAFQSNLLLGEAVERLERELLPACEALAPLIEFLKSSERGLTR